QAYATPERRTEGKDTPWGRGAGGASGRRSAPQRRDPPGGWRGSTRGGRGWQGAAPRGAGRIDRPWRPASLGWTGGVCAVYARRREVIPGPPPPPPPPRRPAARAARAAGWRGRRRGAPLRRRGRQGRAGRARRDVRGG